MKKILYLCAIMLITTDIIAQIDLNDKNWDTLFIEDFSVVRSWSSNKWQDGSTDATSLWRCFASEYWPCGATTAPEHCQAYQPQNAVFSNDHTMKLIGEFISENDLLCGEDYAPGPHPYHCDSTGLQHPNIHYHSGMIETVKPVGYGYYEIECKMPLHDGISTSLWFWSNIGGTYNEIDILEHCTKHSNGDLERTFLSGIWYNPLGTNSQYILDSLGNVVVPGAHRYANQSYTLPTSSPSLDNYHIFGCLWLPERMAIFCDGNLVTECINPNYIPPHSMRLKITQKEDGYAFDSVSNSWWTVNDTTSINYVKAFLLKTNCDIDSYIRNITDFNNYVYSVKHTVTLGATTGILSIPDNSNFTIRAVDSIVIDGGFEVPTGASMTLITQECPFCTDE